MSWYDFAVIGGGIAGASAAYELASRGKVALLEREPTCGQHSTGRSAAIFTECYGPITVRRLAAASRSFLDAAGNGFSAEPVLAPRGFLLIAGEHQRDRLDAALADARMVVPEARHVSADEARELCPVLAPGHVVGGVLDPLAADIDVHGLHQGFLAGGRSRGVDVVTDAEVSAIEETANGWSIRFGERDVGAGVVVNAAGAWCDLVAELAGVAPIGLVPKRRTAFTFAVPDGVDVASWPLVVDADEQFYFKPEGPHLLASPADETPVAPSDVRHEEIDVAIAIERIQTATTLRIHHVERAWAGLRSFVADGVPVAGMDAGRDGFFWLAGQGGYGIKTSPAMGAAAAGLIADGALPDHLVEAGLTAADLSPARLG